MNILATILTVLFGIVALLLIIALFMKKKYNIQCEIIINKPLQNVFDYVKHIKNRDNFNKWAMADLDCRREYKGTDGTVGFIYTWSGNKKAGEGEKEIMTISEGNKIETEIRFVKPFKLIGQNNLTTESISSNQTKVTLMNKSKLKYPLNILIPMIEKGFPKDMNTSLSTLKNILEK